MMKQLITILILLLFSTGYAQQYNPTDFTATNKSLGIAQAVPTDGRSWYFDKTLFKARPFQSKAEVLSFINVLKFRDGSFPVYINESGTLMPDGSFIGGAVMEYRFKGTADNDLVFVQPAVDANLFPGSNLTQARAYANSINKPTFLNKTVYDLEIPQYLGNRGVISDLNLGTLTGGYYVIDNSLNKPFSGKGGLMFYTQAADNQWAQNAGATMVAYESATNSTWQRSYTVGTGWSAWKEYGSGDGMEVDPTVGAHIKNIQQTDIDNWNTPVTASNGATVVGKDVQLGGVLNRPTPIITGNNPLVILSDEIDMDNVTGLVVSKGDIQTAVKETSAGVTKSSGIAVQSDQIQIATDASLTADGTKTELSRIILRESEVTISTTPGDDQALTAKFSNGEVYFPNMDNIPGYTLSLDENKKLISIPQTGGGADQLQADWNQTNTSAVDYIKNKPVIPAQFNPIAGSNMTITGTYPNLTFSSTGGGTTSRFGREDNIQDANRAMNSSGFKFDWTGLKSFNMAASDSIALRTTSSGISVSEAILPKPAASETFITVRKDTITVNSPTKEVYIPTKDTTAAQKVAIFNSAGKLMQIDKNDLGISGGTGNYIDNQYAVQQVARFKVDTANAKYGLFDSLQIGRLKKFGVQKGFAMDSAASAKGFLMFNNDSKDYLRYMSMGWRDTSTFMITSSNPKNITYSSGATTRLEGYSVEIQGTNATTVTGSFKAVSGMTVGGPGIGWIGSPNQSIYFSARAGTPVSSLQPGAHLSITGQASTINSTNLNGGNITISGGMSTGSGTSKVVIQTASGTAGTQDNTPTDKMVVDGDGSVTMSAYKNPTLSKVLSTDVNGKMTQVEMPIFVGGKSVQNGTGIQLQFKIPHGLGAVPSWIGVDAASDDASGYKKITADATEISVWYSIAPIAGTGNMEFFWSAKK